MWLRSELESKQRELPPSAVKADLEFESCSGLALHQGDRHGARRSPWPTGSRLPTWPSMGRTSFMVDLLRRRSHQCCVGSVFVVPRENAGQFTAERLATKREQGQTAEQVLHGADDSLNNGDASVLTYRSKPQLNSSSLAPSPKSFASKLWPSVTD